MWNQMLRNRDLKKLTLNLLFFKIIFIIYFCLFFPGVGLMDDWLNGIMESDCGIYCVYIYIYM